MFANTTENDPKEPFFGNSLLDEKVFEVLFKDQYPRLCIYSKLKYGLDIESAEDIVNTSFIKLWNTRKSLSSELSPKSYLYKIVDNQCLNVLKHEKVKKQHANYILATCSDLVTETTFDSIDLKELRSSIENSISELPEQMRKIFELSRVEGLKYGEIAKLLEISVKTVETQMSRALAKLREKLSDFLIFLLLSLSIFF